MEVNKDPTHAMRAKNDPLQALRQTEISTFDLRLIKKSDGAIDVQFKLNGKQKKIEEMDKDTLLLSAHIALARAANIIEVMDTTKQYKKAAAQNQKEIVIAIYQKTLSMFDRVLEFDNKDIDAKIGHNVSKFYIADLNSDQMPEMDLLNEGISIYKDALEIRDPATSTNKDILSKYCMMLGKDAIALFDRVLKRNPVNMEAMTWKSKALYSCREKSAAMKLVNIILSNLPQNIDALEVKANIELYSGGIGDATNTVKRLLDADPNNRSTLIMEGDLLRIDGQDRKAFEIFRKVQNADTDEKRAATDIKWRIATVLEEMENASPHKKLGRGDEDDEDEEMESGNEEGTELLLNQIVGLFRKEPESKSKLN